ncbi:tRNA (adenosine(37)-N6)-threonylcarbamoyltransferase complex dimerization subunit type 1 TsaB [Rubricoccus marinus]|uniref:tRNA (Adenosine(37)-N6)-threonylcarbamoyltransferase complex dimerization subunit type 1 TsaB n=1 Tax=Rubricoccus marinus TaxID=716817 RepID=A0A259TZX7_9BACT|nr:tRNA (adenosine(37)-N6)-threonylcarbamoyltransferase complex dimerization subunit type 1 TsaB [Rubricoccus marinus]OZC03138.1 tRNA (adenosine(37)-N6)-threonylcarbamoyltransferase complex dimerization subunit type 1 TsaB [Rubricoccus marinus]
MLVLGIETATDVCSVGLVDGERDLASFSLLRPRQHGTRLAGLIQSALATSAVAPEALDGISVSAGPGSYTGLRIGLSIAKGLCLASGADLLAVSTLEALVHASGGAATSGDTRVAVLPSRRGEVYAGAYSWGEDGWRAVLAPEAITLSDVAAWAEPLASPTLVGGASDAASGALREEGIEHRTLDATPSGLVVARLGHQKLQAGETEDVAAYEPAYLKPFVSGDPAARARG